MNPPISMNLARRDLPIRHRVTNRTSSPRGAPQTRKLHQHRPQHGGAETGTGIRMPGDGSVQRTGAARSRYSREITEGGRTGRKGEGGPLKRRRARGVHALNDESCGKLGEQLMTSSLLRDAEFRGAALGGAWLLPLKTNAMT